MCGEVREETRGLAFPKSDSSCLERRDDWRAGESPGAGEWGEGLE